MTPLSLAIFLNLGLALLRVLYILLYPIDLSPEEAQYWDWSRHPDLSYYSKPPMVAYINLLSSAIFGNTEFAVRFPAVLMSFLLSILVFLFMRRLVGERVALACSVLPNLFVGLAINSILLTTDAPLLFFWGISVMLIFLAVEKNSLSLWLSVGVFAGLAFLSKYPAVFLLPLTLIYIFIVRRELLRSAKPYTSLLPALLLSLPVLIWNSERDFVSFKHVSTLAEKGSHFPNLSTFGEFLGGQFLLLSVFPFFFMLYGWWRAFKDKDKLLVFLTVYSLPVLLFFALLSLKKEVYANWAGFGYFTGGILSVLMTLRVLRHNKLLWLPLMAFQVLLLLLLHFTPLVDKLGLRKVLPPKRDPVKVMVGWEKLGKEVSFLKSEGEFIFSTAYQISAELAFYVEGNPRTFVFHTGRMTQYFFWKEELKRYKGGSALFVSTWGVPEAVKKHFKTNEFLKEVKVWWRGEVIKSFKIYRLRGFSGRFDEHPKGF